MAENIGKFSPRDAGDEDDVLGKLDQLLNKHRPGADEPGATTVPELTDSLRGADATVPGSIPTLVDVVSGPVRDPLQESRNTGLSANAAAALEVGISLRLAVKLESERARLLEQIGNDPLRARAVDELITELKRSLPAIVRSVFADGLPRE